MPTFAGANSGHTPSIVQTTAGDDNWALDASVAGDVAQVISVGWGGQSTTSTAYHTRWCRPTAAGTGALTTLNPESHTPHGVAALLDFGSIYATLAPVMPAEPIGLHNQSWNSHGGLGYLALPLASPWTIINGLLEDTIACRNLDGVEAGHSSYTFVWNE